MKTFIQGMRRSGTTIVFDVLNQDGRFDCYYEPLAAATKPAIGGGSGAQAVDFFEKIRSCRQAFLREHQGLTDPGLLNHGAPRAPELEFETTAPDYIPAYLRYLISRGEHSIIKFTRMHSKIGVLKAVDQNARLIHVVRDPRSVTASYIFGKDQRNRRLYRTEKAFFTSRTTRSAWSSYAFSEHLLGLPQYAHLRGCADFVRVLLLWKHQVERTHRDGLAHFPDGYLLCRHEELLTDPKGTVARLYRFMGQDSPEAASAWAAGHVRQPGRPYAADNPAWGEAFDQLGMCELLATTGYTEEVE